MQVAGKTGHLVFDVPGNYLVVARGTGPVGAYSETTYVFNAANRAPQTVVLSTVTPEAGAGGVSAIAAATGYVVSLNGTTCSDPDGSALTYAWTLSSKPAGSAAVVSNASASVTQVTPNVLGDYVVKMSVTDGGGGATSSHVTTISVKNRRPLAAITSNASPVALPTGPTVRLPVNTLTTLRGTASADADGDVLTYAWSISSKPATSAAALSAGSGSTVQITADVSGSYVVQLRVTDSGGAFSEQLMIMEVGNYAPVAVADKNRMTLLSGSVATASAALSFDEDGDALTYVWAIDARPAGSVATIAAPAAAALSFTPTCQASMLRR